MKRELALAYLTTAPLDALDALPLALELGYRSIGIRLAPLTPGGHFTPLTETPDMLRQTVARIKETGVTVLDVEGVQLDEVFRNGSFDRLLAASGELGAQTISVVGYDPDERRLGDSFAHLCDAAAQYQLEVALEFIPYTTVPNAQSALRIVRRAERSNARIAIDFLHASRSRMTREDLADIPRRWLGYAQLCDAPAEIPTTRAELIHAARYARLLPGAGGGIDVRGWVRDLPESLPLSIEIPNKEQLALHGAKGWAQLALQATKQVLEVN